MPSLFEPFAKILMPRLTARFNFEARSSCLVEWPQGESPKLSLEIGDFCVAATLKVADHWRSKAHDAVYGTNQIYEIEVEVSRFEDASPPEVVTSEDGTRDLVPQSTFLRNLLPDYRETALQTVNRILRFFKYVLFTPMVHELDGYENSLHNPEWCDERGNKLASGFVMMIEGIPGLHGQLGVKKLNPDNISKLHEYVLSPVEPTLADTLLLDAQAAWFEGNLRRSILEMAICVEILVKRRFFEKSSPAGAAFDYLEDRAKVSIRVLELLDAVAEEAFSHSYKKQEPSNFEKIDHLFRCRNKIAHRGELLFRSDSGKNVVVDQKLAATWWDAVLHLKNCEVGREFRIPTVTV